MDQIHAPNPPDPFNRPPIADTIRTAILDAFAIVPEGRSSAILAIADRHGARLHMAWKAGENWKVGAVVGFPLGSRPDGYVAVEVSW